MPSSVILTAPKSRVVNYAACGLYAVHVNLVWPELVLPMYTWKRLEIKKKKRTEELTTQSGQKSCSERFLL